MVIGQNASGKTNFVELFKLLRKIYADGEPFPFLDWWGYDNVVWDKKEELPITVKLFFASKATITRLKRFLRVLVANSRY